MKVFTALHFAERPELHMTLTYYGEVNDEMIEAIMDRTDEKVRFSRGRVFNMSLDREAHFGPQHAIRVLLPSTSLPSWLAAFVPQGWTPHVSCTEDKGLILTATNLVLRSKNTEIKRWELP
jgi:hypothetical protein